ncbi:MAG: cellulase family glycosylhydrolase [Bacteroidaceae bacterium]|nr:cellulase family glycosylhydrolase [Bacteroidaceae bacterium]
MRKIYLSLTASIMACMFLSFIPAQAQEDMATFRTWALTPPMGWNSWDCYYSSVTEKEVMQNAQYLVDNDLVKHGWEYVVIDIRWYCNHPSLGGGNYNQNGTQDYVLDEYGRYLPSPTRFPSCMVDGKNQGFKAIADKLHGMGLKFGIHIMRGVPKSVVGSSYKLKGSEDTPWTQVYNGTASPCTWLKDNLLVRNNEAGQLYYNSIMDLYAEWGVDFIKVDDLSRPFYTDEIHMIRKAIDQTGRPMVLSLSPGKTQYQYADECLENANQWRMMDDLWDNWSDVDAVFNEAHAWETVTRPGNYADCDMLPLGQIAMTIGDAGYTSAQNGRWTNLTQNEQLTMMTLWGICHSPLFFGGEMTKNDAFTLSLLTNEEYHQMHKYGENAHQVLNDEDNGHVVWTSTDPATGNRYLALFQRDNTRWVVGNKALYKSETVAYTTDGHAVNVDIEWPEGQKTLVLVVDDGGDNYNYDHGDWINPTLVLRDGTEVELTGTYKIRAYTASYFNRVYENKNVDNGGKMKVLGVAYDRGFSTDANAAIFFTIPDEMDVVRFKAMAAADDSGIGQTGATTSIRFMVFDQNPLTSEQDDAAARSGLISRKGTKSKQMECDVTGAEQLKIVVSNYGDGFAYDRADLINPVLIDAEGNETSLTTLTAASYTSEWSTLHVNQNVEGGTLKVEGQSYETGLGMNAQCTLIYDLPEGHNYKTFRALCGYDSSCDTDNTSSTGTTMEFLFYVTTNDAYTFDLTQLGYGADEAVPVYDIWQKQSLGTATGTITTNVPSHGVKLFRMGDNKADDNPDETQFESAREAVDNMALGWNLGNTLDSNSGDVNNMWIEAWTKRTPSDYEQAWGQPVTKPELLQMFKEAGFNAIRVPVTWYPHMEATFSSVKWNNATQSLNAWDMANDDIGTKVQKAWMKRVHEVVDYVIDQGMYCILNIHHDTGAANTAWLIADEDIYAQEHERFEKVWTQIAEEFKDYDEHLLFEGYNEMLDVKDSWCFASFAANGNYDAAIANSAYNAINSYAQSFVKAVRATGGNNAQRNLIVNTYGACDGSGTWNSHLQDPLKQMKLPSDDADGHLIFEVHSYPSISNLTSAKTALRTTISNLKAHLVAKGAPVIFGEWGEGSGKAYDENRENWLNFARYFVEQAKANNMGTFLWMGLSDGEHRSVPEFNQPDLLEALQKGYYGEEGYVDAIQPVVPNLESGVAYFDLSGRKIDETSIRKGIYLMKQANGEVKKIYMK